MAKVTDAKRRLKVCYGNYKRSRDRHPVINLAGYYLRAFGFNIGDVVELTMENEQIIIRKAHGTK